MSANGFFRHERDEVIQINIPIEIEHFYERGTNDYTPEKAMVDVVLQKEIEKNPKITEDEIKELLPKLLVPTIDENLFESGGFAEKRIALLTQRRDSIAQIKAEHETTEDLYAKLFGKNPVGTVTLANNSLCIAFICDNEEDFKHVYAREYNGKKVNNYNSNIMGISIAECLEPKAKYSVCAVKNTEQSLSSVDNLEAYLEHEDQHIKMWLYSSEQDKALEKILKEDEHWKERFNTQNPQEIANQIVFLSELALEFSDKLEIAAYIAQGLTVEESIKHTKDFYKNNELLTARISYVLENYKDKTTLDKIFKQVFDRYNKTLTFLGRELVAMRDAQYSPEAISMRLCNSHVRQLVD